MHCNALCILQMLNQESFSVGRAPLQPDLPRPLPRPRPAPFLPTLSGSGISTSARIAWSSASSWAASGSWSDSSPTSSQCLSPLPLLFPLAFALGRFLYFILSTHGESWASSLSACLIFFWASSHHERQVWFECQIKFKYVARAH